MRPTDSSTAVAVGASDLGQLKIGLAITTFDRVDDARCCLEIVRSSWQPQVFGTVTIVHAFSGDPDWYSPSIEDQFLPVEPEISHYEGAAALLDAAFAHLARQSIDFAVAMTGDTWAYRPQWIRSMISEMALSGQRLASADWKIESNSHGLKRTSGRHLLPPSGLATDFLIVDLHWATEFGMLPLDYSSFVRTNADLLNYFQEMAFVERHLAGKFLGAVRRELHRAPGKDAWGSEGPRRAGERLRLMHERRIDPRGALAPSHQGHWPNIGLVTTHDPTIKQEVVRNHPELVGPTLERLARSSDLSWFNQTSTDGNQRRR